MNDTTTTQPEYSHAFMMTRWDRISQKFRRTILVHTEPGEAFAFDNVRPMLVMTQVGTAPWHMKRSGVSMSTIVGADADGYVLRSLGLVHDGLIEDMDPFYPMPRIIHVRSGFVPVDADDYELLRKGLAPSHRTRKVLKDWEAEARAKYPQVVAA